MRPTSVGHIAYCLKTNLERIGKEGNLPSIPFDIQLHPNYSNLTLWHFDKFDAGLKILLPNLLPFSPPSPPFSPLSLSLTNSPHPLPTIFSAETKTNLIWYGIPLNKMKLSTPGVALPKSKYGFQCDQYQNIQKRHITSGWKIVWDLKWVYLKFDSKSWEVKVCIRRGWWD